MAYYSSILVAIDLTGESDQLMKKARSFASKDFARVQIIHTVEPMSVAYSIEAPMDFSAVQDQIQELAEQHMKMLGEKYAIEKEDRHLMFGRTQTEVQRVAQEIKADLIVVGSHDRHGLSLLLGSRTDGILRATDCDVLAVHIKEKDK